LTRILEFADYSRKQGDVRFSRASYAGSGSMVSGLANALQNWLDCAGMDKIGGEGKDGKGCTDSYSSNWGWSDRTAIWRKKNGLGGISIFVMDRWRRHLGERMMIQILSISTSRSCIQIRTTSLSPNKSSERMLQAITRWKHAFFIGKDGVSKEITLGLLIKLLMISWERNYSARPQKRFQEQQDYEMILMHSWHWDLWLFLPYTTRSCTGNCRTSNSDYRSIQCTMAAEFYVIMYSLASATDGKLNDEGPRFW